MRRLMKKEEREGMKNKNVLKYRKQTIAQSMGDKEGEKAPETANQSLRPHKHDICHNASRLLVTVSDS